MDVVTVILAVIVALAFFAAGAAKLAGAKQMVDNLDEHLGLSSNMRLLIGGLEVVAAVAIVLGLVTSIFSGLGIAAAIGLVLLMIGAIIFHVRAGDSAQGWGPPAVLGVLSAILVVLLP